MKRVLLASACAVALAGAAYAQEIPIATIGPMTGQYATFGAQMKAGAEMAVADLNKAGGVNGKKLKLIIEDDACDPKQAVAGANKLVSQKVKLVAGHFCSGSSIPASKVYAEEGIVQISPASTNPKLTDERAGPNVFRVCGRDDQQGEVAGKYLAQKYKGKKIAILHDKSAYGKGLADETKKYMNQAGLKEAMYEAYTAGEKDYTALVSRLKQAAVDVVYVGGYHTEAGLIVRQMRDQGLKAQLVSGDALVTQEYWQITGKAGEGTLMTFSPDPRKEPAAADVVKRFRAQNIEPEGYVLYTYAAVQAWAQAATAAKSEDSKKVIAELNKGPFKTVIGNFKFDKKGDPNLPPYKFYEWKDGKYDQIN
ncbi:MAG TPA: branched-chain amino acid ABC transporter substrate-binding protein [Hyphomicrobiaceae bacterium]|nr:branched-chain amino acid ABC transporter substrate-binding protein [Hyphomicrobiaceae bacterium]